MTKDEKVYTLPLQLVPDSRTKHTLADRQAQFALANRLVALLGDMSFAVERINGVRSALADRASKLPTGDPLAQRLRDASASADVLRKKIVATKEGGMITGEERLRENLTDLYSAVIFYEAGRRRCSSIEPSQSVMSCRTSSPLSMRGRQRISLRSIRARREEPPTDCSDHAPGLGGCRERGQ